MWGRWRCDVLSKVTTWHELHENCKVWCTQVGWWGEFCCIVLKAGCNEKCRGWEFFFIWQISKMFSPTPVKSLGVKGLERFAWAHASALHGWGKNAPWIYLFLLSDVLLYNEIFECLLCDTSHVCTDLVVNRHWMKLSFDHISDLRIRMSGIDIPVWLHSMLQARGAAWPIYGLC